MRLIVRFERHASVRYISQLDMLRTIHRALKRADIPVAYSEGYNPSQKVSFGFALSVGLVSYGEYMDITLKEDMAADEFLKRMKAVMPEGLAITEAGAVSDNEIKIGKMIDSAEFETVFETDDAEDLKTVIDGIFAGDTITMERHSKKGITEINVRPWIYEAETEVEDEKHLKLKTVQALGEEMSVRIDDVARTVAALAGEKVKSYGYIKKNMFLRSNGGYVSPVEYALQEKK